MNIIVDGYEVVEASVEIASTHPRALSVAVAVSLLPQETTQQPDTTFQVEFDPQLSQQARFPKFFGDDGRPIYTNRSVRRQSEDGQGLQQQGQHSKNMTNIFQGTFRKNMSKSTSVVLLTVTYHTHFIQHESDFVARVPMGSVARMTNQFGAAVQWGHHVPLQIRWEKGGKESDGSCGVLASGSNTIKLKRVVPSKQNGGDALVVLCGDALGARSSSPKSAVGKSGQVLAAGGSLLNLPWRKFNQLLANTWWGGWNTNQRLIFVFLFVWTLWRASNIAVQASSKQQRSSSGNGGGGDGGVDDF